MLAIRIILFLLPGCLVGHQSLAEAAGLTRLHPREARPATVIAADGELLTLASAPTTTLSPPDAPQAPAPDATEIPSLFDGQASPPQPNITPAPGAEELAVKYRQTTYYTCVTIGTYTHCGIHEPILDASAGWSRSGNKHRQHWAMVAAALTVLGLALGT